MATSTHFTYVYLYAAADTALRSARADEHGRAFTCMTVNVFCALTLEAYLNHIGEDRFEGWDLVERTLSPEKKLDLLSRHLKVPVDKSQHPFQLFKPIFRFRDAMAHGRTAVVIDSLKGGRCSMA